MSKFENSLPEVEINFLPQSRPVNLKESEFFLKINGVKLNGMMGVTIRSPLESHARYPTVEVSFYAKNVKGKIWGLVTQKP